MPTRAYYLQQAQSAFSMAAMSRDAVIRARWIERANEYQILAQAVGEDPSPSTNQQAQQQQQIQPPKSDYAET